MKRAHCGGRIGRGGEVGVFDAVDEGVELCRRCRLEGLQLREATIATSLKIYNINGKCVFI